MEWANLVYFKKHGLSSSIANASYNTSNPYSSKCPEMMTIIERHVRTVVRAWQPSSSTCSFTTGCDASVLLNDTQK
ncbi:unnamed protein product [Malus baccata var. baccata]